MVAWKARPILGLSLGRREAHGAYLHTSGHSLPATTNIPLSATGPAIGSATLAIAAVRAARTPTYAANLLRRLWRPIWTPYGGGRDRHTLQC